jgi:hypothetical protein
MSNMTLSTGKSLTVGKARDGYSFEWHAQCDLPLLECDLKEAQTKLGFAPGGYGFFQPIYSTDGEGRYHARWASLTSSD